MTKNKGFTLIELLVAISIISTLASITSVSLRGARTKAENVRALQHKDSVIKAFSLLSNDEKILPDTTDWVCLGPAEISCWGNTHGGSDDLWNRISPYLTGVPTTNAIPGSYAYNYFKYANPQTINGTSGAFFVWSKTTDIFSYECPPPSFDAGQPEPDPHNYCYYYLGE